MVLLWCLYVVDGTVVCCAHDICILGTMIGEGVGGFLVLSPVEYECVGLAVLWDSFVSF